MCIYIYTKLYNCVYTYLYMYNIGWWFGTFFIFPFIGNNHHPNWLSYFSAGLKPPTRIYIYTYPIVRLCNPWIFSQAGPAELHDDAPWLNSKVGPVALGDYCDMGMVLSPEIWMWTFIIFGICFIYIIHLSMESMGNFSTSMSVYPRLPMKCLNQSIYEIDAQDDLASPVPTIIPSLLDTQPISGPKCIDHMPIWFWNWGGGSRSLSHDIYI